MEEGSLQVRGRQMHHAIAPAQISGAASGV